VSFQRQLQLTGLLVHDLPTAHGRLALLSVQPFATYRCTART
jgi:hypothetical protein